MTLTPLLKFNFKYYRRHSLLAALCLLGISLGVGIVVAVELINNSALASFESSVDFLAGKATNSIISTFGRIDEKYFKQIWGNPNVKAATPLIDVIANTLETDSEPIRFLGVDPFLDSPFRGWIPQLSDKEEMFEFFNRDHPPGIFIAGDLMKRYHLKKGDLLTVLDAGFEKDIRILGPLPEGVEGGLNENLAVMDIASAQEVFGRVGRLDRIDLIIDEPGASALPNLPPGLKITDANSRKSTLAAMLYSFQLNLAAMSLIALFVGVFLIYNFSMFSVLSRRQDMSLLLTLGSDRQSLVLAFLIESLVLGTFGSLIGIIFGFSVACYSIGKVSSTISQLYFQVNVLHVALTRRIIETGLTVGFIATLVGCAIPALEVAITPPVLGLKRQSIEDKAKSLRIYLFLAGVLFFIIALLSAWASRLSIFWGFASAFGMVTAFALFTPGFLGPFTYYLGLLFRKFSNRTEAFLAARNIGASLSRTSVAVSALAVALSMTIGVDTMIYSFKTSVSSWLDEALKGDLYISSDTTKWDHPLPKDLIDEAERDNRVDSVERYATYEVYFDGKPVKLRIIESEILGRKAKYFFVKGDESRAWKEIGKGAVFISESLAFKFNLKVGDSLALDTPDGRRKFQVAAITRDYSSDQGTIQMDMDVYKKLWKDDRVQSIALFLKPGVSKSEVKKSLAAKFKGLERTIVSNHDMREKILTIFDKTFAPTSTLKGVSLLVALLGVATAMMAILMERSKDIRVLGYLGLTASEIGRMNIYQGLIMGFASFLIASVCGLLLTYIIVYAINYRSFGWSIDISINRWIFVQTLLLTLLACFVSSLYPTLWLVQAESAATLKEE
ncbi:MAG: FtsX-like permease family protein [Desulfomonilaceae bacterium]